MDVAQIQTSYFRGIGAKGPSISCTPTANIFLRNWVRTPRAFFYKNSLDNHFHNVSMLRSYLIEP